MIYSSVLTRIRIIVRVHSVQALCLSLRRPHRARYTKAIQIFQKHFCQLLFIRLAKASECPSSWSRTRPAGTSQVAMTFYCEGRDYVYVYIYIYYRYTYTYTSACLWWSVQPTVFPLPDPRPYFHHSLPAQQHRDAILFGRADMSKVYLTGLQEVKLQDDCEILVSMLFLPIFL